MLISDWSSDVCSSDCNEPLELINAVQISAGGDVDGHHLALGAAERGDVVVGGHRGVDVLRGQTVRGQLVGIEPRSQRELTLTENLGSLHTGRSEEHTSELQSLMRISYAVFCLQTKKQRLQIAYTDNNKNK